MLIVTYLLHSKAFILESALLTINKPDNFPKNQEIHNYGRRRAGKVHVQQSSSTKVKNSPVHYLTSKIYSNLPKNIIDQGDTISF